MDRSYRAWYALALILVLVPPSARLLLWQRSRSQVVDMGMAQAGEVLFKHDWKQKDSLSPEGDGLGPYFNATSCVACHNMGGVGGAGGLDANVTTYSLKFGGPKGREGVVHSGSNNGVPERLSDVHSSLPGTSRPRLEEVVRFSGARGNHCLSFPAGVHISQRNTPALYGAKLIDEIPERVILAGAKAQMMKWGVAPADEENNPVGRAVRLASGRIGRFGWKGQTASLADFVQAACANELGLSNPGAQQPTHLAGRVAPKNTGYDLTQRQCDELTAFCASLPKPVERLSTGITQEQADAGKKLFTNVGCAECHTPKLGNVDGIYSDLLLHRMGQELVGGGSYGEPPMPIPDTSNDGPSPSEWRTPPLWGVADSAPYLHDGRANTLEDAIKMHGGQGQRATRNFLSLTTTEQGQLIAFLKTLRAPDGVKH